ncbi:flagellin [Pseudarthrobacter sp. PS3-L1]|uniref:flagellin N-terminal helical domain-containing protein n=1 Tax=Pseudarthrobacter sp. PS3-L1 TaxID=3046207 RepID=UPI0024B93194|nr:flagellin [Pseudarthrobacter sp. PS3-L1]MDJ0319322.1 flagellin [Pseudarthrobacter sp. PS3-L1]
MGMQINTNLAANNTYRTLNNTQNDLSKSLEKLSSGMRINRAGDDAAGLAISEGLKSQANGMGVAARNAQDGISVIQTAEGSLSEVQTILQRVRDLAVQAGNDSNNADSRTAIQTEVTALGDELTRISTSAEFNGTKLLNTAAAGTPMSFQIGANGSADNQIAVNLTDVGAIATAVKALTFDNAANAALAITATDTQITAVSTARADLGASQNRFESVVRNLQVSKENLTAANSRIRDTDMAEEMVKFTKNNILSQAGTAMLAQANQSSQGVLQLLR